MLRSPLGVAVIGRLLQGGATQALAATLTYRYRGRDFGLTDVSGSVIKDILA